MNAMVDLAPEGFPGWVVERRKMTEHSITITENPTIHEATGGSTITHTVAVSGECFGWVVEYRNPAGETVGWGVWGAAPEGLFASREDAAKWLIGSEIEFY